MEIDYIQIATQFKNELAARYNLPELRDAKFTVKENKDKNKPHQHTLSLPSPRRRKQWSRAKLCACNRRLLCSRDKVCRLH